MSKIKAVIFDWAGTIIDFGSFAPMGVFVEAFKRFGIDVTIDEARRPMGLPKRDHIKSMITAPRVAAAWQSKHGAAPSQADIDKIYEIFVPMNENIAPQYADLVPGAKDTIDFLKAKGIKIGSTTGYTRSIMERIVPIAAAQGFAPETMICADDLAEGRPGPLCMYKCFVDLAVYPPSAVVKVDDTEPGIMEGSAAGCTTVGVTLSGNEMGKTKDELAIMSEAEISPLREMIARKLRTAGAVHIIDTVADLPELIDKIEAGV